jgi:hypothetical protein
MTLEYPSNTFGNPRSHTRLRFTWLLENNAVLTKDNMIKKKWVGNPSYMFCPQVETVEHLFFQCTVARCVWGIIGACLGANNTPINTSHYKIWILALLPNGGAVYHFGFAVVCWAI